MQCPNLGRAEHGVPKMSPIARINEKAETLLGEEDAGACSVQSVISTDATEELFLAENNFLKETTIT